MTTDLTVGKPSQKLFWFSIPLLLSVAFQQLYQMADSIIVGRFAETVEAGELALAAVGASYPITQLFVAVATGINIGTGVLVSTGVPADEKGPGWAYTLGRWHRRGEPALVNDPALAAGAQGWLATFRVPSASFASCGSDDFATYGPQVPILMQFVGTGEGPAGPMLHDARYLPGDQVVRDVATALLAGWLGAAASEGQ